MSASHRKDRHASRVDRPEVGEAKPAARAVAQEAVVAVAWEEEWAAAEWAWEWGLAAMPTTPNVKIRLAVLSGTGGLRCGGDPAILPQ